MRKLWLTLILLLASGSESAYGQVAFVRGDANDDGIFNIADGIFVLGNLFSNGPNPNCEDAADANADGMKDIADGIYILAALFGSGIQPSAPFPGCGQAPALLGCASYNSCGACCTPSTECEVMTEAACLARGGTYAGPGTNCDDFDGDRIPDVFELGNCQTGSSCFSGSDPFVADTDNDGINDGDEFYGTLAGLDLPSFGVDPCRKDILLEADWVFAPSQAIDRNKPHPNQVNRLVAAFENSGVANPNGQPGIKLHFDVGQAPYGGGNSVADPSGNTRVDVSSFAFNGGEYFTIKGANFASNRNGYFRYCVMCDAYSVGGNYQNSSGLGELPGDDCIVSMGQWATGNDNFIGNTIMHELGHNLNLRHGGFENRNFKPNYNSVMNYWYQFCGTDLDFDAIPDDGLDFSRQENITLTEGNLVEQDGVTGVGPGIDWNGDGDTTDVLSRNINCRLTSTFATSSCSNHTQQTNNCGSMGSCWDSSCGTLQDYDDWSNVELFHLNDFDFAPPEIIHCWIGP